MKIATCLQHVPFEGPGVFGPVLEARGYGVRQALVPSSGLPEDVGDFLLIMGGPMSVNDSDVWIAEELQFVQSVLKTDVPVLGICFGSQILAKALGGSVVPGPSFEIGMVEISMTDEGKRDPLICQLPPTLSVFQWHGEGIVLPGQQRALMASSDFPIQAFRAGERSYGLLFHLEIEEAGIQDLCRECPEDIQRGNISVETVQEQSIPHLPTLHKIATRLIEHLVQ